MRRGVSRYRRLPRRQLAPCVKMRQSAYMRSRRQVLGDEVRDAREAEGYRSRTALATAAGVSLRSIDKIEQGQEGVGPKVLGAVARTLGWKRAHFEDFVTGEIE